MRLLLTLLVLAATSIPANAISRLNSTGMSCSQVKAVVAAEGAVILRYPSRRVAGLTLYNRYVRNGTFCESNKYGAFTTVPTRDRAKCPVLYCKEKLDTFGG